MKVFRLSCYCGALFLNHSLIPKIISIITEHAFKVFNYLVSWCIIFRLFRLSCYCGALSLDYSDNLVIVVYFLESIQIIFNDPKY